MQHVDAITEDDIQNARAAHTLWGEVANLLPTAVHQLGLTDAELARFVSQCVAFADEVIDQCERIEYSKGWESID